MKKIGMPSEHDEQVALMAWCDLMAGKHPELKMMFAIPNGGNRDARVGAALNREGVRAGVPDLFLPVARGGWHGCFIEMKKIDGKISLKQKAWIKNLRTYGYLAVVCYSAKEASEFILDYLRLT